MGVALFYLVSPLRSAQFAGWARGGRLFRDSLSIVIPMLAQTRPVCLFEISKI